VQEKGAELNWQTFEEVAPEMAAVWKEQFERSGGVMLVGTIRSDGTPRISNVDPSILAGEIYLGMMWHSRKAVDLLRDPRILVRNPICSSTGEEVELSVRGRAIEIHDPQARRRYVSERTVWKEVRFHLFSVDIESVALIKYGGGEQSVKLWPQEIEYNRPYP
jgi:hypothetical protein